ncbi:hypothetical protein Dimus_016139 [Dionaea muscipula]
MHSSSHIPAQQQLHNSCTQHQAAIAAADPSDSRPLIQRSKSATTLRPMNLAFKHKQQRSIAVADVKIKVRAVIRRTKDNERFNEKEGHDRVFLPRRDEAME